MNAKDYITSLISTGQIQKAIDTLGPLTKKISRPLYNQLMIWSASYSKLEKDRIKGVITAENDKVLSNQINQGLLEIVDEIPADKVLDIDQIEKSRQGVRSWIQKNRRWLIIQNISIPVLALLLLGFTQSNLVRIKLDLQLDRIQFKILEDHALKLSKDYDYASLRNFGSVTVPAVELTLSDQIGNGILLTNNEVQIRSNPSDESNLNLEKVTIEEIHLKKDAKVILEVPDDPEIDQLLVLTMSPGNTKGKIIYENQLNFQCSLCQFDLSIENNGFVSGTFIGVPDKPLTLNYEINKGLFILELESNFESGKLLEHKLPFSITDLALTTPDIKGNIASSIKGGQLDLINTQENSYQSTTLEKGTFLNFGDIKQMDIKHLIIDKDQLTVSIIGTAEKILKGSTPTQLVNINPSRLNYLFHMKLPLLLGIFAVILGFVALPMFLFRKS